MSVTQQCIVDNCDKVRVARGLCTMHYQRHRRTGVPKGIAVNSRYRGTTTCTVENCDREYEAKGMCKIHYNRVWNRANPRLVPYAYVKGMRGKYTGTSVSTYRSMIARCYYPANRSYQQYGESGITVCERWLNGDGMLDGFECFVQDMGERPTQGHTIDRKDNEIGYTPENCRWADRTSQAVNRRKFKNNISGHTGVLRIGSKYKAQLRLHGKSLLCSMYDTYDEAVAARKSAEDIYFKPILES